jgi:hypothetical protein
VTSSGIKCAARPQLARAKSRPKYISFVHPGGMNQELLFPFNVFREIVAVLFPDTLSLARGPRDGLHSPPSRRCRSGRISQASRQRCGQRVPRGHVIVAALPFLNLERRLG